MESLQGLFSELPSRSLQGISLGVSQDMRKINIPAGNFLRLQARISQDSTAVLLGFEDSFSDSCRIFFFQRFFQKFWIFSGFYWCKYWNTSRCSFMYSSIYSCMGTLAYLFRNLLTKLARDFSTRSLGFFFLKFSPGIHPGMTS